MDLTSLGVTNDELKADVLERIVQRLLSKTSVDDWGDSYLGESEFKRKIDSMIESAIDTKIQSLFDEHIYGRVDELLNNIVFHRTSHWGEPKGESWTLREYLEKECVQFLESKVSTRNGQKPSYSSDKTTTRLEYLLDEKTHKAAETAARDAVKKLIDQMGNRVSDVVRQAISDASERVKVSF